MSEAATQIKVPIPPKELERIPLVQNNRSFGWISDQVRLQLIPLIVPVTLIHHYVKKYGVEYLKNQVYLAPSPKELMLRNHV